MEKKPVVLFQRNIPYRRNDMSFWRTQRLKPFLLFFLLTGPLCWRASAQTTGATKQSTTDSLELHLGKGYEALKEEKYDEAEKEFRAALASNPELAMRARFPLAVSLYEQHKYTDSRQEFEAVRRSVGDQPGIWYYLGRLDLDEQNFKGAVENLSKASAHPPFPDTAFYLGLAYLKQGPDQEAEKWLKKAIELNPQDSRAEYQLATLYRKEGRQQEASQAFQQSKEKKAQSDKRSQLKWECAQELDRGPNTLTPSCDQLYDPNDADLLTSLGVLYGQHGQLEKALKPLQRAAELQTQSPQTQYNLAFTYFQLKRFEEARDALQGPVQRWPDLFPLNSLYGAVLWNLGEVLPAYQVLHHAHQLNSQDGGTTGLLYQSLLELAKRSEAASENSEALRYLKEAASLSPTDPEPHRRMAEIYRHTGDSARASEEERKADELAKSSKN